jgi:hypothetical protein
VLGEPCGTDEKTKKAATDQRDGCPPEDEARPNAGGLGILGIVDDRYYLARLIPGGLQEAMAIAPVGSNVARELDKLAVGGVELHDRQIRPEPDRLVRNVGADRRMPVSRNGQVAPPSAETRDEEERCKDQKEQPDDYGDEVSRLCDAA